MKQFAIAVSALLLSTLVSAEVKVTSVPFEQLLFFPSQTAPASVVALNRSKISAEITAKIISIDVQVGDSVKAGSTLAKLDCKDIQYELASQNARMLQLNSQLEFDKRQLDRGSALAQSRSLGEADLDQRKTAVLSGESQLAVQEVSLSLAKLNVERCDVVAPYDGVVVARLANVGEMAPRGQAIVEILQLNNHDVSVKIPVADVPSFLNATSYQLVIEDQVFPLTLRVLQPFIENFSSSREARLEFSAESALNGANGRIQWRSASPHLPAYLLQSRNGVNGVFVAEKKVARFIEIEKAQEGRPIPFNVSLTDSGMSVIIDGRQGLIGGESLEIVPLKSSTDNHPVGQHLRKHRDINEDAH